MDAASLALVSLALGAIASMVTTLMKKHMPEMDGRVTQLAVFGVCFVIAMVVTIVQKYAPVEVLATLGTSFSAAIAWYEVATKKQ